jgi:xanthine dehydrogenase molybdenum-binding subunit
MGQELKIVGKRLPLPDAWAKATGTARYVADIKLPGMLIGKVLRSPYPHADILKINTSKAENLRGVEAVITHEDVPKKPFNSYLSDLLIADPVAAGDKQDEFVLNNKARYVGDAIAAVAAVNEHVAQEALELIEVEYQQLPAVFDPIEAMKPEAPKIHDFSEGNVIHRTYPFARGDLEKGFNDADHIVKITVQTGKQKHCQLEPSTFIAAFDENSRLNIWSACQMPHIGKRKLADIFEIPEGMIRWVTPAATGGFGNATSIRGEPICAALAKKTDRPVKLEYTRAEEFIGTISRQPTIQTAKMGVKNDGTITALWVNIIQDSGTYFSHSRSSAGVNLCLFFAPYRCDNIAGEVDIVYTNSPVSGEMRGYGNPQAMFTLEQLVDIAAEKIGMDPVEFRLKNHRDVGEPSWIPMVALTSCALDECLKLGAERIGWKEKKGKCNEGTLRRGVGVAINAHVSGAAPYLLEHSSVSIRLNEDGSAILVLGVADTGQGILGGLAQIAAEELGLNYEDVHIVSGDTDATLFDVGCHASRSIYAAGQAIVIAARKVKNRILDRAAKRLNTGIDELDVRDGRVYLKSDPEKSLAVAEICRDAIYSFNNECEQFTGTASFEPKESAPPFQAVFAEIELDTETGVTRVLKLVVAHDIGRAINPASVEGQLEGGAVQGLGYTLLENFIIDKKTGATVTDSFTDYKIPSTLDSPEVDVILVEQPDPTGPFGAKSVGESAMASIAPAIANAIYNAVGVRIRELPITPDKVLKALKSGENI